MMPAGLNPWWSVLMLVLVLGMIPAGAWLARRLPGLRTGGSGSLSVLDSMNIGPRERVMVIRAGSQTLLIGATAQSIALLATLPDEAGDPPDRPATDTPVPEATDVQALVRAPGTDGASPRGTAAHRFSALLNRARNDHAPR